MSFFIRHKKTTPLKPQANPYASRAQKWHKKFGLPFLLILVIAGPLYFYKPLFVSIEQGLFEGTALLQDTLNTPYRTICSFFTDFPIQISFRDESNRLHDEIEKLKRQVQTLSPLQHENEVLRQNLRIPAFEQYGNVTARILSSPFDGFHQVFLIAAGNTEGLQKEQAVIVKEGVVGRLERVGTYVSRVLLLNDASSRIPVMTSISQQKAILAGNGSFFPTLLYVADVRKIQHGEQVVTSGLGGIFPPGLPVGIVDEMGDNVIRVRPYVPFQDIEWVHVLQTYSDEFVKELHDELRAE